jgi:hypothetical protein
MTTCDCDVCNLLQWLDEQTESQADRAVAALTQALWRVLAETETGEQAALHQALFDLGMDPHTMMMLRTAVKLASWELSAALEDGPELDEEGSQQPVLH